MTAIVSGAMFYASSMSARFHDHFAVVIIDSLAARISIWFLVLHTFLIFFALGLIGRICSMMIFFFRTSFIFL